MFGWLLKAVVGYLPSAISAVKEYVGKKQEINQLERTAAVEIKKAELTARIDQAKALGVAQTELDKASVEGTGFKDEYLTLITTFPLIMILMVSPLADLFMLPSGGYHAGMIADAMHTGFTNLQQVPEYYWYGLGLVYLHDLGMRRFVTAMIDKVDNPFGKGK